MLNSLSVKLATATGLTRAALTHDPVNTVHATGEEDLLSQALVERLHLPYCCLSTHCQMLNHLGAGAAHTPGQDLLTYSGNAKASYAATATTQLFAADATR